MLVLRRIIEAGRILDVMSTCPINGGHFGLLYEKQLVAF